MKQIISLKGYRPITFVEDGILIAKGYEIYNASLDCTQLRYVVTIPHNKVIKIASRSRLLDRIFRLGVRYGRFISRNRYLLAEKNRIWLLYLNTQSIKLDHIVDRGSRPLSICYIENVDGFDDVACYGEYWGNSKKDSVNIWIRNECTGWQIAYTFPKGKIKHVHAVIPDKKRSIVWILTGDIEHSSGIWVARNNFSHVTPLLVGQQEFRCCWFAFLGNRIIYATDSPIKPNSVRELVFSNRVSNLSPSGAYAYSKHICDIVGSSIYSCMVQNQIVFSTTVEPGLRTGKLIQDFLERSPGPGIKGNYSDLIIGNPDLGFSVIGTWFKDKLLPRLCEFGTISFPTGTNPGNFLYAYFTGLSGYDGRMSVFELPHRFCKTNEGNPYRRNVCV